MSILIVILFGIVARFAIPGDKTLLGFAKTIIVSFIGSTVGSLTTISFLYMMHRNDPLIETNYGYATKPLSDADIYGMVISGLAGAALALIIYGFAVHRRVSKT